jgi:hypothetical protein
LAPRCAVAVAAEEVGVAGPVCLAAAARLVAGVRFAPAGVAGTLLAGPVAAGLVLAVAAGRFVAAVFVAGARFAAGRFVAAVFVAGARFAAGCFAGAAFLVGFLV